MIRFQVNVIGKEVIDAAREAEGLLDPNSAMMNDIFLKTDWKYDSGKGVDIRDNLLKEREAIKIFTYRPVNPWTRAIGYFDGKAIHINIRKLPGMKHSDLVGLLLHEYAHYCGYKHGNNWPSADKKLHSVPYWLSSNVEKYL